MTFFQIIKINFNFEHVFCQLLLLAQKKQIYMMSNLSLMKT